MTRAQLHICFIDKQPSVEIDQILQLNVQSVFDSNVCRFTDLGSSLWDWYEQAQEYHENGVYDKAIKYYQKSGECATIQDIIECQIGLAESERNYNKLIKYALLKGDVSLASKYQNENTVLAEVKDLVSWFTSPTVKTGILDIIKKNYEDFSQEEQKLIYSLIRKKLRNEAKVLSTISIVAKGVDYNDR